MWRPIRVALGRSKESIAAEPDLFLDLDTDGQAYLASLRAAAGAPTPPAVFSSSLVKYRLLCRVDGITLRQQANTHNVLAIVFGGACACTDGNRVSRLPGFLRRKHGPAYRVTVVHRSDSVWNCHDFHLDIPRTDAVLAPRGSSSRKRSCKHTNSDHEWAWVLDELARAKEAAKLTRTPASRGSAHVGKLCTGLELIANQLGKKLDEDRPVLNARLPDGSRLAAVIPPVVRPAPALTIRKFTSRSSNSRRPDCSRDAHALSCGLLSRADSQRKDVAY